MSVADTAHGAGLRFEAGPRAGRAGHWWRARTTEGSARGVLRFDPAITAAPGVVDRLVATVVATRQQPGVLPIVDLVSDAGQLWLITGEPAAPTVADLLDGAGLDQAAVLTVARETGGALAGLHRAGLVHGGFGPDTVVVGAGGEVWLAEVGLLPALRHAGVPPDPDTYAWAAMARTLSARLGDHRAVDLLRRCSRTAEQAGLDAAVAALAAGEAGLGQRTSGRDALAAAAGRARVAGRVDGPVAAAPTGVLAGQSTQLGQRAGERGEAPDQGRPAARLRFGPGVGTADRPPAWTAAGAGGRRRRRRRLPALASGLVTVLLVAGVAGYLWQRQQNPLVVTGAVVAPVEQPGDRCDVTVDVVGTIQTNGHPGTVTYQWVRSDGETSAVLDQSVPRGRASTQVHLFWSFSGQGRYEATATLKILAPTPMETSGQFTYACD